MKPFSRRQFVQGGAVASLGALGLPLAALAQAMPENLRVVCGFAPGGTSDTISRRVGDKLAGTYARSVVVENRAGAGGRIAIDAVKAANPDGTSLLLTPGSMLFIYPHIYKQLSYNPFTDLMPVSTAANIVHAIAVGPGVPDSVKSINDFIAWCKANPAKANYGSPAAGSTPHFIGALIEKAAGVQMNHIAFKGTQLAIVDLMGGQIPAVIGPDGEFLPHMKSGRVRVLATSGPQRSKFYPDVPTFSEQGMPGFEATTWFGVSLPKGAPPAVVKRLHAVFTQALKVPEVRERLVKQGFDVIGSTPEEFDAYMRAEMQRWSKVVKESRASVD